MGEAKRRGTFEEREKEGIAKRKAESERILKALSERKKSRKLSKSMIMMSALLAQAEFLDN